MKQSQKNRTIWLCGASTGIGYALANDLINSGAQVIVSSRNLEKLKSFEGRAYTLQCDVKSNSDWNQCVEAIGKKFGSLDTFIYNAGDCQYLDVEAFDYEMIKHITEVNYLGLVKGVEQVLPLLRKGKEPYLVGVSSSVDSFALSRAEAYGASKAAMTYFLESLRIDLVPESMDVTIVKPGFVKTPLTDKNDFPMPFIISAEEAGQRIMRGLTKRSMLIDFPKKFTYFLRFMGILPTYLRFKIARSLVKS